MDLIEVLRDFDENGSFVETDDRNDLLDIDNFEEQPAMTWTYLIMVGISTLVGNVGNFLVGYLSKHTFLQFTFLILCFQDTKMQYSRISSFQIPNAS